MTALGALQPIESSPDEKPLAIELLKSTPPDQLEAMVRALKTHCPTEEIRKALVDRLARVPLDDFDTVKHIYLKHCGDPRSGR